MVDAAAKRAGERLVGQKCEILCEGPSKTNPARLMGRTRSNKIVVFEGREDGYRAADRSEDHALNWFSLSGVRADDASSCDLAAMEDLSRPVATAVMIYHLSLHTAGLIAGPSSFCSVSPRFFCPADNFLPAVSPLPRRGSGAC